MATDSKEDQDWAAAASMRIGVIDEGPPPPEMWGTLVAVNDIHPSSLTVSPIHQTMRIALKASRINKKDSHSSFNPGTPLSRNILLTLEASEHSKYC